MNVRRLFRGMPSMISNSCARVPPTVAHRWATEVVNWWATRA
ncbi:MAG: hypothetical protein AAGF11_56015 [Myxococcota bacterium]